MFFWQEIKGWGRKSQYFGYYFVSCLSWHKNRPLSKLSRKFSIDPNDQLQPYTEPLELGVPRGHWLDFWPWWKKTSWLNYLQLLLNFLTFRRFWTIGGDRSHYSGSVIWNGCSRKYPQTQCRAVGRSEYPGRISGYLHPPPFK